MLTSKQTDKARAKLADNMKKASADFRTANPSYKDIAVNMDDARFLASIADGADYDKKVAELRIKYVMEGRDTSTLDLLSVKTEENVADSEKFIMTPYLPAKKYKKDGSIWKSGYQAADGSTDKRNKFITASGSRSDTFMVLRAKGLFQLMSDAEVDAFVKDYPVDLDLYVELFL